MKLALGLNALRSFSARKKIGHPAGYGFFRFGHAWFGDPGILSGVYHTRRAKGRTFTTRMRYYRPTNPQSVPQEANRTKFANAMTAWGALTLEQKAVYTERAKKRGMFPWGLFIREYYSSN